MAFALCSVVVFTSCKSSESAYKKAYEKAQAQAAQQEQATTTTTTTDTFSAEYFSVGRMEL